MAQVAPINNLSAQTGAVEERGVDETDNVTAIELHKQKRIIYFSDGPMEESSDSDDNDMPDKVEDVKIDTHDLPLTSRVKHKASKVGASLLAGIDYVGGGLASFFGITTPKYACEQEYYKQVLEEMQKQREEDASAETWLSREHSSAEVVTMDPRRDINRNAIR